MMTAAEDQERLDRARAQALCFVPAEAGFA